MLRNLVLQDIKYCKVPMYLAAQQQNKLTQFPVCANVGVLFSLEIPPQSCEKRIKTDFLFSNLGNVMPCFGALSAS